MTTPQQIRDWLKKMQYPNLDVEDKSLEILCRGSIGLIFQQIIDRVKPKQEIEFIRKAILAYTINKNEGNINKGKNIEKLKLYNEKIKLEKELRELNLRNAESNTNLEHLKSRIKAKNVKYQINKKKLHETERNIALVKAKTECLDRQIENCKKMEEESKVFEKPNEIDEKVVQNQINKAVSNISKLISSADIQQNSSMLNSTNSENSVTGFHTSLFLSSNHKPLSAIKRSNRANSTHRNIIDKSNNFTLLQKRNFNKLSSFNLTSISSISSCSNRNVEVFKELEKIFWNDQDLKETVEDIWKYRENVFKLLVELKERHRYKIADMIAESEHRFLRNMDQNFEKLYAFHVRTELKRISCIQEQKTIAKMLESVNTDNYNDLVILQSKEEGLKKSIEHVQNFILNLQKDLPDNSDELEQIVTEIQNTQTEIMSAKSKVDSNLNILKECSSWMPKLQNSIIENIKRPNFYSEYDLLDSNYAEQDAEEFLSCSFQHQNQHYFDSWLQIYSDPELLKIFHCPFLSPENAIKFQLDKKKWLQQLESLKNNENIKVFNINCVQNSLNDKYKKSIENLKNILYVSSDILTGLNNFSTELKYYLESPLNDCVAIHTQFKGKTLKEYCEIYETYYKQL